MALRFLGKDPGSDNDDSPTVWLDEATGDYILQGWVITDENALAQIGHIPPGELVMRFPHRMLTFFPEGGGRDDD